LFECPGSRTLIPLVPESKGGPASWEGSQGHWQIAARLVLEQNATEPAGGLLPPDVPTGYAMPKYSTWMIDWALRQVAELIPADWYLEVEVPLAYEFLLFILSGHLDLLAVSPDGKHIKGADWKLGYDAVDAADVNSQILGYLGLIKRAYPDAEDAEFFICQPRNDPDEGFPRVSSVKLTGAELDSCVSYLEGRVNASLANPFELNTGRKQCRWCPVSWRCPAILALVEEMKTILTPEIIAKMKTAGDAEVGDFVITSKVLAKAFDDAEAIAKERITKNGRIVAGCGINITQKHENGKYAVKEPIPMFNAVRSILPAEEIAGCINYSTTRLKDSIAKALSIPKTGQAATTAKSVFDAKLLPYLEQGKRTQLIFT
jgi:hypothetical protein